MCLYSSEDYADYVSYGDSCYIAYLRANAYADYIANIRSNEKRFVYYDKAPDFLKPLLESDVSGIINTIVTLE